MPILNLQKRARELGRIRLGQKGANGAPQKLDRFRITSNSQALLEKIAQLYGGEVRPWEGGTQSYEVVTDSNRLPIMVPPQPITQWHEAWRASGCIHRCDGQTNALTDEPCDPEDPAHIEAMDKPTTRLNVVLRDVEGVGVFRVESHGWYAAQEIPDAAEFLAYAGGYVNGWLSLDPREDHGVKDGRPYTHRYMVPIIEIDVTPAQLMAGHGRVAAPSLTGGPVGETPALAAAGPDYVALAADMTTADQIRALWRQAHAAGHMTQGLSEHLQKRVEDIEAKELPGGQEGADNGAQGAEEGADRAAPSPEPDADGVVEAEIVPDVDADAVWQRILTVGYARGMTLGAILDDFPAQMGGLQSEDATAGELVAYLDVLNAREDVPA